MIEPVTAQAPALRRPRILRQSWLDLTFIHWAVDPASIAHFYPPGTRPDTFEGRAYVGLIPFRMTDIALARGPALLGDFLETNIRLYSVDEAGRRGVVFLTLEANRADVVAIARTVFALPYRRAEMRYEEEANIRTYTALHRACGAVEGGVGGSRTAPSSGATAPSNPGTGRPMPDASGFPSPSPSDSDTSTPKPSDPDSSSPAPSVPGFSSRITVQVHEPIEAGELELFLIARWGLHTRRAGRTGTCPTNIPRGSCARPSSSTSTSARC